MTDVFIIHGSYGSPEENWFPWLEEKIEELGHKAIVPRFPTPDGQSLENWKKVFKTYESRVSNNTVFIGHSLGPAFILSILERINRYVKSCFFVAGFTRELGNPDFDKVNKTFYKDFNWTKIKQNCSRFYVFHSDNDPYVPLAQGRELAKNLGVELIVVENAGHFNEAAGYKSFDMLLEMLKGVL